MRIPTYIGIQKGATANDTARPRPRPIRQEVVRPRSSYFMSIEQTDPAESNDTRTIKSYENPVVGTIPNANSSPDTPPHATRSATATAVIHDSV